ncbi:MAG: sugar ABC transporter ATP-binding protein [Lentisphaeria bacterium]|nr:sugar ABC transporter ATP-binding protein [Lentisphaeria bacterium]
MLSPIFRAQGVHKHFGPVHALKGVDLDIYPGEVHALIGENGAGKSTLMKVLSGAHLPSEGQLFMIGEEFIPSDPQHARESGIAMIYQELTLAPHLTIEENICLGMEQSFINKNFAAKIQDALDMLGQDHLSPNTKVSTLPIGTRQLVEIARAIVNDAKIVILDEPTSSLSTADTKALFKVMNKLRDQGVALVYISHFLEEVQEISDRYTILRDGQSCGSGMIEDITVQRIIELMVGRSMDDMYPRMGHEITEEILSVSNLAGSPLPKNVSFKLHKGEILGIFGLVGAGRSEAMRVLFGLDPMESGQIKMLGKTYKSMSPAKSLKNGLDFLSEDRKAEGLAQGMSIAINTTLSSVKGVFINLKDELKLAGTWAIKMRTKCHSVEDPISSLSGGNQQKVALARMMYHNSQILILDEPTRGIDVGSKSEIYAFIQELAQEGKSIIVISSYLPELQGVCDSLAVMYRGNLSPVRKIEDWDEHTIMEYATTGTNQEESA